MEAEAPSPAVISPVVSPDDSWTVSRGSGRRRAHAELTGMSRKTKAELLAALGSLPPSSVVEV